MQYDTRKTDRANKIFQPLSNWIELYRIQRQRFSSPKSMKLNRATGRSIFENSKTRKRFKKRGSVFLVRR